IFVPTRSGAAPPIDHTAPRSSRQWTTMTALTDTPLLPLLLNLLLLALLKVEPTAPFTAVLLANKSLLSSPMVAPETDALAPLLLLAITELATFRIAPLAETRAALPLANRCAWLTVPMP